MNKEQLVAKIAEKSGLKKPEAQKALAAFQEAITESVAAGEKVQLIGFGTFDVRERAAREEDQQHLHGFQALLSAVFPTLGGVFRRSSLSSFVIGSSISLLRCRHAIYPQIRI